MGRTCLHAVVAVRPGLLLLALLATRGSLADPIHQDSAASGDRKGASIILAAASLINTALGAARAGGPTFTSPPKDKWYGWNDDRYCQWEPEECAPSPYAIDAVTCYLDNAGYVVGLKYYYTNGLIGGQLGDCGTGISQDVSAGEGGVFVGVKTCRGAWGGYKNIQWFTDCGDAVTCGNTRTDMLSWDYWGRTWGAPQPPQFCVNWLNPNVWGQGYLSYFGGYQTMNTGFRARYSSYFAMWVANSSGGLGAGHRRSLRELSPSYEELLATATAAAESPADDGVRTPLTNEVQQRVEEVQAKALLSFTKCDNSGCGRVPPYWETCQYINSRAQPPAAMAASVRNAPWYRSNPLQVKGNNNMWRVGSRKTSKRNWIHPDDNTYMGYLPRYNGGSCPTDYNGYYRNIFPIWKITASCFGGAHDTALSNLQFSFNKCYCPCSCNSHGSSSGGGGSSDDDDTGGGTGVESTAVQLSFKLGCACEDIADVQIDDLVGASSLFLQGSLEAFEGLGANSVQVEFAETYNATYDATEPGSGATCTKCTVTVDAAITANPGFDQQVVYNALVLLATASEDLCTSAGGNEDLDCASYLDLFPECQQDGPDAGMYITVYGSGSQEANADKLHQLRALTLKSLVKANTNLQAVKSAFTELDRAAGVLKSLKKSAQAEKEDASKTLGATAAAGEGNGGQRPLLLLRPQQQQVQQQQQLDELV